MENYDSVKHFAIKLVTKGYSIKEINPKFGLIINDGKDDLYVYIHRYENTIRNQEQAYRAFDEIYKKTNNFYFLSFSETELYSKVKVNTFKWIRDRLGGINNVKGKLTFSHFK